MSQKITHWHIIFSHHPFSEWNRTLQFKVFNRRIVLCTRCTGQYTTFAIALFVGEFFRLDFSLVATYLLPLPATLDWLTQALKFRESKTWIRLITGGLFGVWLADILLAFFNWNSCTLIHACIQIVAYVSSVLIAFMLKKGSMDVYLKPYEDFVEEYQKQKTNVHHL
jgi:uncharacterized membrane protein